MDTVALQVAYYTILECSAARFSVIAPPAPQSGAGNDEYFVSRR